MNLKLLTLLFFVFSSLSSWAQLTNGQLVHYPFDGNTQDIGIHGLDATPMNNPSFTSNAVGIPNSAILFNGTNQYVAFPNNPILKPTTLPVTFSFWVKPTWTGAQQAAWGTDHTQLQYNGFWFNVMPNFYAIAYGDGQGIGSPHRRSAQTTVAPSWGNWQHIVCIVRAPTDIQIFIDCVPVSVNYSGTAMSGPTAGLTNGGAGRSITGATGGGYFYLNGAFDEFRMWNRGLSMAEIQELCTLPPCVTDSTFIQDSFCQGSLYNFGGQLLSSSGNYNQTYTSSLGCDSIINLDLSQISVSTGVVQSGFTLTASIQADAWQWINCEDGQAIQGANGPSFTASVDGFYGVVISENGCTDTSDCFNVFGISLSESARAKFNAYPNPHRGSVQLSLPDGAREVHVEVRDLLGRLLLSKRGTALEMKEITLPMQALIMQIWADEAYLGHRLLLTEKD